MWQQLMTPPRVFILRSKCPPLLLYTPKKSTSPAQQTSQAGCPILTLHYWFQWPPPVPPLSPCSPRHRCSTAVSTVHQFSFFFSLKKFSLGSTALLRMFTWWGFAQFHLRQEAFLGPLVGCIRAHLPQAHLQSLCSPSQLNTQNTRFCFYFVAKPSGQDR